MRVGASRTAPEPRNLSSTEPHSPRLRNPNQLRRGERYPLHTAPKWGQSWTPIEGQSSTPIDTDERPLFCPGQLFFSTLHGSKKLGPFWRSKVGNASAPSRMPGGHRLPAATAAS